MREEAVILGSNGYITVDEPTDLVKIEEEYLGWGSGNVTFNTLYLEAKEEITISVNGKRPFPLLAGDNLTEEKDLIRSLVVLTPGKLFRYLVKC